MMALKLSARLPINGIACALKPLVSRRGVGYLERVTVNPVNDLGRSGINLAHRRPIRLQALFLCPQYSVMVAVRGTPSGVPGSKFPGRPTRVQSPPFLAWPRAVVTPNLEFHPMKHAFNPSAITPEQRKAYCTQLVKTMLRYSSPDEIQRLTSLLETHACRQIAVRYNPGLNDAKYDLFRRFWLEGGAQ